MGKFFGGIALFVGGISMTAAMDGEVLWYGAIVIGLLMVISGSKELSRERAAKVHTEQIVEKREDLYRRLLEKEPIDRIAEEYGRSDQIPPIRTIQAAANVIREMRDEDDAVLRGLAEHMVSDQIVDSNVGPEEAIDRFSFHDEVYFVDDQVLLCRKESNFGHTPGTLILNKGYLFFFERSRWSGLASKIMHSLGGSVPILGCGSGRTRVRKRSVWRARKVFRRTTKDPT